MRDANKLIALEKHSLSNSLLREWFTTLPLYAVLLSLSNKAKLMFFLLPRLEYLLRLFS